MSVLIRCEVLLQFHGLRIASKNVGGKRDTHDLQRYMRVHRTILKDHLRLSEKHLPGLVLRIIESDIRQLITAVSHRLLTDMPLGDDQTAKIDMRTVN